MVDKLQGGITFHLFDAAYAVTKNGPKQQGAAE
jgi:hypothetical protein